MAAKKAQAKSKRKKPSREDLIRNLGEKALTDLIRGEDEIVEVLPPAMEELAKWLELKNIKGKFPEFWHLRIADARDFRLTVPPIMDQLAGLFDEVFKGTSNTFNVASRRPHVTEPLLLDFLKQVYGIEGDEAETMTLMQLAMLLENYLASRSHVLESQAAGLAENAKKKGRRGRPPDSDIGKDQRILEAWKTGRYPKYADLAREFRSSPKEIRQAIDRQRKRKT